MQLMMSYGPEENKILIPGLIFHASFTIFSNSALCSALPVSFCLLLPCPAAPPTLMSAKAKPNVDCHKIPAS